LHPGYRLSNQIARSGLLDEFPSLAAYVARGEARRRTGGRSRRNRRFLPLPNAKPDFEQRPAPG